MKSLIAKQSIKIDASPERVWQILTKPEYIRQWGSLPEDFGDYEISPETVLNYPQSRLSVALFEMNKALGYSLYMPTWEEEVTTVGYTYRISADEDGHTWLTTEIGDFAILVEGDAYYKDSLRFSDTASHRIKELAEKKEVLL
ncbi:hypothetical protein AM493_05170 [Flavobacterium akiainvivens]|uniref:Polyketide cyclase n=1 Tax=Flavobacterium akiainvivens TaxID=1202724 RepID=A0A0M9VHE5_9FLAO|nr:SRPBCC domain-containing protein [Flavobacterium akiainvivens]KOS05489.1 hypothetical protein AM493_05170 [Flavobacterium akiainvivens]SFQ32959.1 Activator of Hsp90 ATPase homolog 1-like protein [Flavobacterium akiainvivens]